MSESSIHSSEESSNEDVMVKFCLVEMFSSVPSILNLRDCEIEPLRTNRELSEQKSKVIRTVTDLSVNKIHLYMK
jgi:hypothetical protein